MNDSILITRLQLLSVASIGDVLASIGRRDQILDASIAPMSKPALAGRAFTWLATGSHGGGGETYDRGIDAVDSTAPGDVVMIATGGNTGAASWGELLSLRASALGARGAVSDGAVRDVGGIREMDFPVFAAASNARDARSRLTVMDYQIPIISGGVVIAPGDFVLADLDGVVTIPQDLIDEVLEQAEKHLEIETLVRQQLRDGISARQAFDEHNVL